ncbi:MAG: HD domain-containing protein [Chloroflexota bacterium]
MADTRLAQQIAFVMEIDKLKTILRQTSLMDNSRRENSAEHSWHLAVMALTLGEYAEAGTDLTRVVKMVLVHDIVEIDAGDTFAYDAVGYTDKNEREEQAATRIFGLLPDEQRDELMALWHEFEAITTPEARFANALDRLEPLLGNYATGGGSWQKPGVTLAKIQKRMEPIGKVSAALGEYVQQILADSIAKGYIRES